MTWQRQCDALIVPPPRIGGAVWADDRRVLSPEESSWPGRWRSLPWQRGILDAVADERWGWVVILKAAQMSASELMRNAIGRWAEVDPADVLWVMAGELAARTSMAKLVRMFLSTPSLRALVRPGKARGTRLEMRLTNGMRIVIGWAGSPQSLASDPFPRVIGDEVGLYPHRSGSDANPIRLFEERTKTFGRRAKIVLLSKPSHDGDLICSAYRECLDRRVYVVQCPSCGSFEDLTWGGVRWPGGDPGRLPSDPGERIRLAAHLEGAQSACVGCPCGAALPDPNRAPGEWRHEDGVEPPESRRIAFHVAEFLHWTRTPTDLVVRGLRCLRPSEQEAFWTGSLGRPYSDDRSALHWSLFAERAVHDAGVVPEWATCLIATADTQLDHWWWMVRAWGPRQRSRCVAWGRAETTEDLHASTLGASFPIGGTDVTVKPQILLVDSAGGTAGGRLDASLTHEVYRWASETPGVIPLKGIGDRQSTEGTPIVWTSVELERGDKLELAKVNTQYWMDALARLIRAREPVVWEECRGCESPDYARQMSARQLVREENTKGVGRWMWRKVSGRADHLFDCAAYQLAGAEIAGADGAELLARVVRGRARLPAPTGVADSMTEPRGRAARAPAPWHAGGESPWI